MRKRTATVYIAKRPYTRHIGAQMFVDVDITILVRPNPGFIQSKIIGVRDAADRNQQVRTRLKNARSTMMDALEAKDTEAGDVAFRSYCSVLDKAAKGGVIKKNTAVRRKTNAANGLRKIAS